MGIDLVDGHNADDDDQGQHQGALHRGDAIFFLHEVNDRPNDAFHRSLLLKIGTIRGGAFWFREKAPSRA